MALPLAVSTLLGVLAACAVCSIDAIGINILRRDHVQLESRPPHLRPAFFRRPKWILGMSMHGLVQIIGGPVQLSNNLTS